MLRRSLSLVFITLLLLAIPTSVWAQNYSFSLDKETVNLYWNEDGSLSIDYVFVFTNDIGASPIDFVDVGLPNDNYDRSTITADINGQSITDISESPYVTYGVALGLGINAIPPGNTGTVHAFIKTVRDVLYTDNTNKVDASAAFIPTWFDSQFVHGPTEITVIYHLPPGVQPDEPRWHQAPAGFPETPETLLDDQGRVTYVWPNLNANGYTQYTFGASFPKKYVPASAIVTPNPFAWIGRISFEALFPLLCVGFIGFMIFLGVYSDRRRKMKYLPPKIAIEGHGIKRGLTAVEAAILMEQPMDKVLSMILFSAIKKNAAQVISRDPLEIKKITPLPENLHAYEIDFLASFEEKKGAPRRKALQKTMVDLVKAVGKKIQGFSRRESVVYYRNIIDRAWAQVTAADTPEVKSEKFDEVMEWTMLDRDYEDRTHDVFRTGPVFVPIWWGRFDPGYGGGARPTGIPVSTKVSAPSSSGGPSLPTLPGSAFAASVVNSVQNFSSGVIGNLSEFTSGITNVTNPPPKPSSGSSSWKSGGGGGGCACACAGCACACAGGGR